MWKTIQKSLNTPDSYVSLALGLAVVLVVGMITYNYFKGNTTAPAAQTENKTEATTPVALPAKHTVKAGETLWSIANTYYKSGYNWVDLQKSNNIPNANLVAVGQELTIPDAKPIVPTGQTMSTTTQKKDYTVASGDSLWKISIAQYQNGYKWTEIARVNNLKNPNLIHVGQVLTLP